MSVFSEAKTGLYVPHSAPADRSLETVTALSFGNMPEDLANIALAHFSIVQAEALGGGERILAQWQVAEAVIALGARNYLYRELGRVDPTTQKDLRTSGILREAKPEIGGDATVLVAQAYHAPRTSRIAEHLEIANELPVGLPRVWNDTAVTGHQQTTSPEAWYSRERLAIPQHVLTGQISINHLR